MINYSAKGTLLEPLTLHLFSRLRTRVL